MTGSFHSGPRFGISGCWLGGVVEFRMGFLFERVSFTTEQKVVAEAFTGRPFWTFVRAYSVPHVCFGV